MESELGKKNIKEDSWVDELVGMQNETLNQEEEEVLSSVPIRLRRAIDEDYLG